MLVYSDLQELGARFAGVTEKSDGDCSRHAGALHRDAVCRAAGLDVSDLVCGEQVHGTRIAVLTAQDRGRGFGDKPRIADTDGLVTSASGLAPVVFVADCVPIHIFDPVHRAGGVVHAGREGTRGNIACAAIVAMREAFETEPQDVHAVIGPSAGPCCYAVSAEMASSYAEQGWPVHGRRLDLWEMNLRQLTAAGVPEGNIRIVGMCTICSGRFHSYRKDGGRARNMGIICL